MDALQARDAGPGGDRSVRAMLGDTARNPAQAETVVVYRNSADSARGILVPVVISRAESLAIAAAVQQRLAGPVNPPAPSSDPVHECNRPKQLTDMPS